MKIRVAYDISVLASYFDRVDAQHGIFRVVEEVLAELCKRDDLEITALGLGDEDPLTASFKALLYLERKEPVLACLFRHTFRSPLGLTGLYSSIFHATLSGELGRLPQHSARAIYLRGARSLLYRLAYTYNIGRPRRVFSEQGFDVFHCPGFQLVPKEITRSLPRVFTVYDLIPIVRPNFVPDFHTEFFRKVIGGIDIKRDWATCISEFTKHEFCEYSGMSSERVFVTPLASSHHFRPVDDPETIAATRLRYGVPQGQYFLCLAAPQPRKNLTHLIRCFFRLLDEKRLPDTYLVLAGSKEQGWMYDEIFAAAESSSAHRSRLIFTGFVADEDLAALYSGALAFVFPSLYEGFGLPALEAMACGTVVITSNTTSLPEVVGSAAILVDPTDTDALCDAMLTLVGDDQIRMELGRRGLQRAGEFSWKRCADETAKVYHAAVSERLGTGEPVSK